MRAAGQRRVEPLFLTIGTRTTTSLLTDDFETNQGWTVLRGEPGGVAVAIHERLKRKAGKWFTKIPERFVSKKIPNSLLEFGI